jgi:hypothetical protein
MIPWLSYVLPRERTLRNVENLGESIGKQGLQIRRIKIGQKWDVCLVGSKSGMRMRRRAGEKPGIGSERPKSSKVDNK